ncbi:MAG: GNAT family protein [Bacilli bacterium]|nr:GNAT family protein [Bacilli bacterium]
MLRLRPYKKCDAKRIVSWIKDEISFRKWCADRYNKYPINENDINSYYSTMEDLDTFFPMTAFDETGIVGHLIMRFIDENKKILRFGFIIVDDKKRGQGYGKEMLQLSIKYAFEILKIQKITLGVFDNNKSAYYCYKAIGFQDVKLEDNEYYHILNEDWKCLELEIRKP